MMTGKDVILILTFAGQAAVGQLSAQGVFSPNDFKLGEAATVYRENLALWNAAGTNTGYASILCSVPASERFVLEVEAQKTSELAPELSIRYGSRDGKTAALFYITNTEFKIYTSDTLAGYSGELFFVFKIGDASRRDVNIYIRRVVIKTFKAVPSPPAPPAPPTSPTSPVTSAKTFSALFIWNANDASEEVEGYILNFGASSRQYDKQIQVGNVTQHQLSGFSYDTKYYVALQAYNSEGSSDYSNEVAFSQDSDTTVACDLNNDGEDDYADYESFAKLFGVRKYTKTGRLSKSYKAQYDFNDDGKIDSVDRDLYVRQCCYCKGIRVLTLQ
jgi:hypothetical protein